MWTWIVTSVKWTIGCYDFQPVSWHFGVGGHFLLDKNTSITPTESTLRKSMIQSTAATDNYLKIFKFSKLRGWSQCLFLIKIDLSIGWSINCFSCNTESTTEICRRETFPKKLLDDFLGIIKQHYLTCCAANITAMSAMYNVQWGDKEHLCNSYGYGRISCTC